MISVVVPNWNGKKLLEKNLPLVFKALPRDCEVIIIDDGSTDGSKKMINDQWPMVKLIANNKNKGFVYTANRGVKEAKGDFVVLINTDVIPQKGFLKPALKHFEDEKVFAVSLSEQDYGWAKIWWRGGFIHIGDGGKSKAAHISAWASGGSAIFRKSMWRRLGGFDPLYGPFYWEDFDIGFRAWKNGWKIIWEPKARALHQHESTTSKVNHSFVNLIKERNQLLFIWKNMDGCWWKLSNCLGMVLRSLLGLNYLKVIWAAKKQYCLFDRPRAKENKLTAREVIALFKK